MPTATRYTATTVPTALYRPGRIDVAPRNAPAKAGSRAPSPTTGDEAPRMLTDSSPAPLHSRPPSAKQWTVTRPTGTPASNAALALPPLAYTHRPQVVYSIASHKAIAASATYRKGSGIPRTSLRPAATNHLGNVPVIVRSPVYHCVAPRARM